MKGFTRTGVSFLLMALIITLFPSYTTVYGKRMPANQDEYTNDSQSVRADLVVDAKMRPAKIVHLGEDVTLNVTIINKGKWDARDFIVSIIKDPNLPQPMTSVLYSENIPLLHPKRSTGDIIEINLIFSENIANKHSIAISVDPQNTVNESQENNNNIVFDYIAKSDNKDRKNQDRGDENIVFEPQNKQLPPDLVGSNYSVRFCPDAGDSRLGLDHRIAIANKGLTKTRKSSSARFSLRHVTDSQGQSLLPEEQLSYDMMHDFQPIAGQSGIVLFGGCNGEYKIQKSELGFGQYHVYVQIDPQDAVNEGRGENNNTLIYGFYYGDDGIEDVRSIL